ncbi:MAG: DUF4004 family protein [Mobilitalea sp.]
MNLISKKDLLAITGISYGQLYRWKRERLIPDEWFIKQSAYTGQETFFPREQILSRIHSILEMKDSYSLEELAKILSPETTAYRIPYKSLEQVVEIAPVILESMPEVFGTEYYELIDIVLAAAITQASQRLKLSRDQIIDLLQKSITPARSRKVTSLICSVFYAGEEYHTVFYPNQLEIAFDSEIEVKEQVSMSEITDMMKLKYKHLFIKS